MSLRELIESAIPHKRRGGRYAVIYGHPFDPEGLPFQQIEDTVRDWCIVVHANMLSLGRRPKSATVTVSQGYIIASCTLRLAHDEEAMSLQEDLLELACEHAKISVQPLDQL